MVHLLTLRLKYNTNTAILRLNLLFEYMSEDINAKKIAFGNKEHTED